MLNQICFLCEVVPGWHNAYMAAFFGKVDLGWHLLDKMNLISGRRESVRGMGFYVCKVCFLGDFLWYGAFVFLAGGVLGHCRGV